MKDERPQRDLNVVGSDQTDANLTVEELAVREKTSPATVRYWVHTGTAPRSFRAGKRRLFPLPEVIAWEKARMEREDENEDVLAL